MSISSCYETINRYNSLKSNLNNVVSSLNSSVNKLSPVANKISSVYSFDTENTPIVDKCSSLSDDISKTSSYISNSIIPAIDSAINDLRNEISYLEAIEREKEEQLKKQNL
jgi:SMC interacting uncharacterized protein involved in chromosome segregation